MAFAYLAVSCAPPVIAPVIAPHLKLSLPASAAALTALLHIARFDAFNNAGRNATEKAGGKPHDCCRFCGRGKDKAYSRCAETARNSGNRDTEQYYAGTYDNVSDYPVVCIIIFLKFPNGGASVVAKREYIARSWKTSSVRTNLKPK